AQSSASRPGTFAHSPPENCDVAHESGLPSFATTPAVPATSATAQRATSVALTARPRSVASRSTGSFHAASATAALSTSVITAKTRPSETRSARSTPSSTSAGRVNAQPPTTSAGPDDAGARLRQENRERAAVGEQQPRAAEQRPPVACEPEPQPDRGVGKERQGVPVADRLA